MMVTVFMVYQVEVVRLDPLQLVLVGTALEVSAFIFEIPTGIIVGQGQIQSDYRHSNLTTFVVIVL